LAVPIIAALPAAAAVVVVEDVAAGADVVAAAAGVVAADELVLLELPHAASATAQAAIASTPAARNLAALRVVILVSHG
jgi:hypothetical protein